MILLVDQNILLDVYLNRRPWVTESAAVWQAHLNGHYRAHLAAFTVPTLFYVIRRHTNRATAVAAIRSCLTTFEIVPVDRSTLILAESFGGRDFEDALQVACAIRESVDAIITRDLNGFPNAPIPVWSPANLIARLPPPATP